MPASPASQLPAPPQEHSSPTSASRKAVRFGSTTSAGKPSRIPSPSGKAAGVAAGGASHLLNSTHANELFSPGPTRQDSWTIEAQRSDRMAEAPGSGAAPAASEGASPSPSLLDSASLGAYTPASAGFLESARKVDDLRGRLEGLEAQLREMESKAVAQLDRSLQEKVLATAAKIVQKRFLADKELDKKLQQQILRTAIKVVDRRQAATTAAAAGAQGTVPRGPAVKPQQQQEEQADPTRRLEFEQGEPSSGTAVVGAQAQLQAYVAHIEQGLGEVVRRLEKKVDGVASLLDQNVLELLEARMAGGLVKMEARLAAVEQTASKQRQAEQDAASDASGRLLERVTAVEAAMTEQSRAVTDLLAALTARQGTAAAQQAAAAMAAVQAAAAAAATAAAAPQAASALAAPAAARGEQPPVAEQNKDEAAAAPAPARPQQQEPASQLVQRKAAVARRSMLGDPDRSAAGAAAGAADSPRHRPALPRLKTTHAAGTAQQIAIATARQQLARQAARAREEGEAEVPVWVSMVTVFGWALLVVLGLAAGLIGVVAALFKTGRLQESDLAFLWE